VRDGVRFRTECDTEVLLAMFARYGAESLLQLNGIFAFAVWDTEREELFLARDRLGVKPLYYAQSGESLYFASEIKAILPALRTRAMNQHALADYLTFLWTPDPTTLFEGVYQLPPGHHATFAGAHLSVQQYWDISYDVADRPAETWFDLVRTGIGDAVTRQMISDVPLGSFLSGGLDSSAIVASMKATGAAEPTTFTVGFSAEDLRHEIVPDDVVYARKVGRLFGVDYNERILDARIVDLLPRLIWHLDNPIADPAAITTYLICSAARERLTVILSGMGGDELFAGYPRYLAAQIARVADRAPTAARTLARRVLEPRLTLGRPGRLRGPRRNLMKALRGLDAEPSERYLLYSSYYRRGELDRLLTPEVRDSLAGHDPLWRHREYLERAPADDWLNRILYVDLKTFLPGLNLAYTDRMSMAASTEVRVPLLDDELVSLAARIPPALKLHRLTRKYVFKRSFESVLPHEIVWRRKAGFGAPIRAWLVRDLREMVDDLLSPATIRRRGLFEPAEVQRLIGANLAGREDNALRIWALLTLELWFRRFLDGSAVGS
jgi:asparagine synthase (glutamine-hydrolysing)